MKNKEIIVHIGMHKTGTTSIQRTLHIHLDDPNFSYVQLANSNHSREIFTLFEEKKHPSINKVANIEIDKTETKKRLISHFQNHSTKTPIISGESIRGLSKEGLMRFKNFLDNYFQTITIVVYIRPPKGYMESAFQQIVKDGANSFNIEGIYPNYRKFEHFFEIFGEENVKLWKFNPKDFPQHNVVLDFCHKIGIQNIPKHIINENESLSKEALSLLYIYRKFGPGYGSGPTAGKENHRLIQTLSQIKGHKIRFGPKLIKPILKKYQKDIEWMEKKLGESLHEKILLSPNNIREEKDLLTITPGTIKNLKKIMEEYNVSIKENMPANTPKEIATMVHLLHQRK